MTGAIPLIATFVTTLISILLIGFGGVILVKKQDQKAIDRNRFGYVLTFPGDLPTAQVLEWAEQTISSLYVGGFRRMVRGVPSMALTVDADANGITWRIYIPYERKKTIVGQLHTLIPGMHVDVAKISDDSKPWKAIVELGEKNPTRTLSVSQPRVLSASILNSLQPLKPGERISWQLVVSPAVHQAMPQEQRPVQSSRFSYKSVVGPAEATRDEIQDRRAKLSEMNVLAVLRIAADADTEEEAQQRLSDVRSALMSTSNSANRIIRTRTPRKRLQELMTTMASPAIRFPMQLSITELVSLLAWPIENPNIIGRPRGRTRQIPPTESVAREGLVVGDATFSGGERPMAITPKNSLRHIYCVGPSGSGKSTELENILSQAMWQGSGMAIIDPKNDKKDGLFYRVLDLIPPHRIDDVVILDVLDTQHPVGLNVLQGNPTTAAADIQGLFEHLYPRDVGALLVPQTIFHTVMTLMATKGADEPLTFADIRALCLPWEDQEEFSKKIIDGVSHIDELRHFWKKVNARAGQRETIFAPLDARVWQLLSRREILNIIGQSKNSLDIREILTQNKILIVNVGGHGAPTARLVGSFIVNMIWTEVQNGATRQDKPFHLCMDEFQEFMKQAISPKEMLNQARGLGLSMILANQYTNQLDREIKEAVLSNTSSQIVFRTDEDAALYARKFGDKVSEQDFQNLRAFEIITSLATDDGVSGPVTGKTRGPVKPTGTTQLTIERSRAKYSRPVAEVEAEIKARHTDVPKQQKRAPKLGSQAWEE